MSKIISSNILLKIQNFLPAVDELEKKTLVELGIDSFVFIQIILELEKEFKIEFEDKKLDIDAFKTIEQLVEYVEFRGSEENGFS